MCSLKLNVKLFHQPRAVDMTEWGRGKGWLLLHSNQVFRFLIKLKAKAFKRLANIKIAHQVILLHFLICNFLWFFYNLHSLRRRADHITRARAEELLPKISEQCR